METSFSTTTCPTCKKNVITVDGLEWSGAHYMCGKCFTAFKFKHPEDDLDDVEE